MATLRLGDTAPDFTQDSSEGPISFHRWWGGAAFDRPVHSAHGVCAVGPGGLCLLHRPRFQGRCTGTVAELGRGGRAVRVPVYRCRGRGSLERGCPPIQAFARHATRLKVASGLDLEADFRHIPALDAQMRRKRRQQLAQLGRGRIAFDQQAPTAAFDRSGLHHLAQGDGHQWLYCLQARRGVLRHRHQLGQGRRRLCRLLQRNRVIASVHGLGKMAAAVCLCTACMRSEGQKPAGCASFATALCAGMWAAGVPRTRSGS